MNYININQIDSVLETILKFFGQGSRVFNHLCSSEKSWKHHNDWLREWVKYDVITLFHKIDPPFSLSKVINDSM